VLIVFNQKHFPFNFRPTIVTAFKDNHGIKLSNSNHEIGGVYILFLSNFFHAYAVFFFRACLLGSDYNFFLLVFLFLNVFFKIHFI
jgi:hypothetical protein